MNTTKTYLAAHENGKLFVKRQNNGDPCWYSTYDETQAARFDTKSEAKEWAEGQFRKHGIVIEVANPELMETEGTRITSGLPKCNPTRPGLVNVDGEWIDPDGPDAWFIQHQL